MASISHGIVEYQAFPEIGGVLSLTVVSYVHLQARVIGHRMRWANGWVGIGYLQESRKLVKLSEALYDTCSTKAIMTDA